jgi:hypothetical protein
LIAYVTWVEKNRLCERSSNTRLGVFMSRVSNNR